MEAYLDYNATTPLDPDVVKAMMPYLVENFGNASSFHKKGQAVRHGIEVAREAVADFLGTEPGDIVFTSGGTEADNLALKGTMEALAEKRNHLVVSAVEHQAVLHAAQYLDKKGFEVDIVPVDKKGIINLQILKDMVSQRTALVSVMHANNEVGTVQPIHEIAAIAHAEGALFHTDAVQSFGKIPIEIDGGIDMLSASAHKICGPKGAGALYIRKGIKIRSLLHGGHQEKNVRPGTENAAAAVGFGEAVRLVSQKHSEEAKKVERLRSRFEEGLKKAVPDVHLNGHATNRIYNTVNFSFEGLDGETLLMNLDLKNIYVSTGSACTAGSVDPSHVLLAMGISEKLARAAIRFSVGRFTTDAEIDYALKEIPPIVERLRKSSTGKKQTQTEYFKRP